MGNVCSKSGVNPKGIDELATFQQFDLVLESRPLPNRPTVKEAVNIPCPDQEM